MVKTARSQEPFPQISYQHTASQSTNIRGQQSFRRSFYHPLRDYHASNNLNVRIAVSYPLITAWQSHPSPRKPQANPEHCAIHGGINCFTRFQPLRIPGLSCPRNWAIERSRANVVIRMTFLTPNCLLYIVIEIMQPKHCNAAVETISNEINLKSPSLRLPGP